MSSGAIELRCGPQARLGQHLFAAPASVVHSLFAAPRNEGQEIALRNEEINRRRLQRGNPGGPLRVSSWGGLRWHVHRRTRALGPCTQVFAGLLGGELAHTR